MGRPFLPRRFATSQGGKKGWLTAKGRWYQLDMPRLELRHLITPALRLANRGLRLVRPMPAGLRILLLHHIPPEEFAAYEQLVAWLARTGRLVGPDMAETILTGEAAPQHPEPCLVSFDDGFQSNVAAAKVLERHNALGLFFVCPGLMELAPDEQAQAIARNIFLGTRKIDGLHLMDWDAVEHLAATGHRIGNHTLTHRRLTQLSAVERAEEIDGASHALATYLGKAPQWFAFPFGDIDSIDATSLETIGRRHQFCRSGVRGANTAHTRRLTILADHVDLAAPVQYQRMVVEGALDLRYADARARLAAMA